MDGIRLLWYGILVFVIYVIFLFWIILMFNL